mgnify:FL=1
MNVLLIWPVFPKSYWSFESVLELVGKKALVPPLGMVTVAALLPQDWSFRLVDKNVRNISEDDWAWADMVMLSAMIVQRDDFLATIREAKRRALPVAVGGPYVTSVPEDAEAAGADHIVMDEGEITIPMMVGELRGDPGWRRAEGEDARRYTALNRKPEMHETPVARFDLLDLDAYDMMAVQYSRGCPFLCEFCDIINLYGRVPRTKPVDRMLAEFQALHDLGWRGGVFLVDDNFIGNKKNVKALLTELREWQHLRGVPFFLQTEASIDLAADEELLDLMIDCNFDAVFLGIETPDVDSLELTRKHQNNRGPMSDAVRNIHRKGMRVMSGFIIGFDGESPGAGDRIVDFVEQCNITHGLLSMLQVLPNTGLYTRLAKEGRLKPDGLGTVNQTTILNFVPTRPAAEITREYLGALRRLYDPVDYMGRVYRYTMEAGLDRPPPYRGGPAAQPSAPKGGISLDELGDQLRLYRAAARLIWRQGVQRESRRVFWKYAWSVWRTRPERLGDFLVLCAHNEHFMELTEYTVRHMEPQIPGLPDDVYAPAPEPEQTRQKKRKPAITTHLAAQ